MQGEGLFHRSTEYRELMILGLPPQCQVPRSLGTFTVLWTPPSSSARERKLRPWAEAPSPTALRDQPLGWDSNNQVSEEGLLPNRAWKGWGPGLQGPQWSKKLAGSLGRTGAGGGGGAAGWSSPGRLCGEVTTKWPQRSSLSGLGQGGALKGQFSFHPCPCQGQ